MLRTVYSVIAVFAVALAAMPLASAAEAATKPGASAVEPSTADRLAMEEQQVADKYKHLEEVLLRMAELNGATDPRRAALLRKVVAQSRERLVGVQFETVVELLKKDQLARAVNNQGDLERDLRLLLELLMSENREKLLASEKTRIRKYLERLGAILNQEQSIQGRTAGGANAKSLAEEQGKVAGKTGDLAKDIKTNEESGAKSTDKGDAGKPEAGKSGESKSGESKSGESKSGESKSGESKSGESKPGGAKPGQPKPAAGKPGKEKSSQGKQGEAKPAQGQSGEGQQGGDQAGESKPGEGQQQDQENPAQAIGVRPTEDARGRGETQKSGARRRQGKGRGGDPRTVAGQGRSGADPSPASRGRGPADVGGP